MIISLQVQLERKAHFTHFVIKFNWIIVLDIYKLNESRGLLHIEMLTKVNKFKFQLEETKTFSILFHFYVVTKLNMIFF